VVVVVVEDEEEKVVGTRRELERERMPILQA
jgi:hypothetical protein